LKDAFMSSLMLQAGAVICEVAEEARRDRELARRHLLKQTLRIVGADFAALVSVRAGRFQVVASSGFSDQELHSWRQWYDYREDPLALAYLEQPGLSGFSRPMLVDDKTWKRSDHVNQGWKSFGLNESAASCLTLADGDERLLTITRAWGLPPFQSAEVELLQLMHHSTAWLDRSEQRSDRLPPRLQRVYQCLLGESSEKEIGARLGLTVRTVHKYTEQIYRALDVRSRAELMCR
jgi:hypothetical protein